MEYQLNIEPDVLDDLQQAVDYYNTKQSGLGERFYKTVDRNFTFLKKNHHSFSIRYDDIRCMPVSKFPYLIHYRVLEKQRMVSVKAVFCTYENPEKWLVRIDP